MALSGNKGDWSEPYALLKLLAEGKLYLGGDNFEKIKDAFYPIMKILRLEKEKSLEFSYDDNLILIKGKGVPFKVPISEFVINAQKCFKAIKTGDGAVKAHKGAFEIPEIEKFLASFSVTSLKAKSKIKNDITIQIEDPNTFISPSLGFSIKSQMGRPSTLVNSSGVTNFTFQLSGNSINAETIKEFNQTEEFSKKFKLLKSSGIELKYESLEDRIFRSNLSIFGTAFDKVLAEMLLLFCANNIASENRVSKFIEKIAAKNPVEYDLETNPELYEIAMKQFLIDYALGMRAGEVWKKDYQASGGYLIVKDNGDVICYHFYFIKNFGDYLMKNTMLDTGSTNRHKFGIIYKEKGIFKVKLNLQIRFIK